MASQITQVPIRSVLSTLLVIIFLTACTQETVVPATPLAHQSINTNRFPVAQPIAYDALVAGSDTQISEWLKKDHDAGANFATTEDIIRIPSQMIIAPTSTPAAERSFTSNLFGPMLIPYKDSAVYRRDWVETAILSPQVRFAGVLYLGGSFHVDGEETHDLLVTVLLDYHQIDFALGGKVALAHIVRISQGQVLLYDFSLLNPLPEGEHVLSIVVNWDPWNVHTTRAVQNAFARQGRTSWKGAGPLMFDHLTISNKYLRVGAVAAPPNPPRQTGFDVQPIPPEAQNSLILSRVSSFSEAVRQRDQALAADEPGKLYAYVSYQPPPEMKELQHVLAVLVLYLDDHQIPVAGQQGFFWDVEAGKQYRIPFSVAVPADGQVHALYATISFTPFLPSIYFEDARPEWLKVDTYSTTVVPLVPSREWISWLPEIH